MENGEFLTQIAQFSQASGINELQKSFTTLADSMTSNQVLQASSLVGRSVLIESSNINLASNGAQAGVELPSSTASLKVTITDGVGQVIRQVDLGQQGAGRVNFVWDGADDNGNPMPTGRYKIKAEMLTNEGSTALDTLVAEKVESVTMNNSGVGLTVNLSGIGNVELSKVKEIM
jgi:flagellar basal-body rod modification protein FlgD